MLLCNAGLPCKRELGLNGPAKIKAKNAMKGNVKVGPVVVGQMVECVYIGNCIWVVGSVVVTGRCGYILTLHPSQSVHFHTSCCGCDIVGNTL